MIFYNEVHLSNRQQFLLVFTICRFERIDELCFRVVSVSEYCGHADVISGRDEKYLNEGNISHQFKMIPPCYEMKGRTPTEENPQKKKPLLMFINLKIP